MSSVSTANNLYARKEFNASLTAYRHALARLTGSDNAPPSLISHCERRIVLLEALLDPMDVHTTAAPMVAGSTPSQQTTPTTPAVCAFFPGEMVSTELPKVSIVIPHFDSLEFLPETLQSIDRQPFKDIEVIVIDDASPRAGPMLESTLAGLLLRYPLRLIQLRANRGPSHCRNLGIAVARGRMICFLDADDCLDVNSLQSRWELLNGHACESAAFTSMKYFATGGTNLDQVILAHQEVLSYRDFTSNRFPCSAVAIKRKYVEADRFDERLTCGEDYEFFSRLAQRGVTYRECKGTIHFRQHASSLSHKDILADVRDRMLVSQHVYQRTLDWAGNGSARDLVTWIRHTEVALRAFPVACVLALRGELQRAFALAAEIDFDLIAAAKVGSVAGTVRFIISREFIVPSTEVPSLLASIDPTRLASFLAEVLRQRHRRFAGHLLRALLSGPALKRVEAHLYANMPVRLRSSTYADCMEMGPDFDYVVLRLESESLDEGAQEAIIEHLRANQDLEGLLLYKTISVQGEPCVLIDSIGPASADNREMQKLGLDLFPGVVLDRESFLIVRGLVPGTGDRVDESSMYRAMLRLLSRLRLKVVGGVPGACLAVTTDTGRAA